MAAGENTVYALSGACPARLLLKSLTDAYNMDYTGCCRY